MKRKLLSIILAVFMVFGIIPFTSQASDSRGYTDAYETLTKEMDNKLEDGKEYEFIVEIFENNRPVSRQRRDLTAQTFSSAVRRGRELSLVEKRINDQNEVLADIFGERQIRKHSDEISYSTMSRASSFRARNNSRAIIRNTEQLKTMPRYKALLNGFALKMTYAEAKQVAMLPNVKAVTKAVEYKMPVKPSMATSKKIINANVSTERGYDGRGRIVAILDTGADVSHPDFRLSEKGLKAAKYNKEKINAEISKYHLWGRFETDKIPYAYNYADRSFELLDEADHGQHIAGTIAGNAIDPSKGVVGVVPEAQLMVMRVFPIGKKYTNTAIYAEAIDDAVLLGADSINMSLGGFAGSEDADEIMTKVVKNANEHGTLVCIAGGNDGYQFSQNHYQPSDILDFATVGAPATMKESLAVASYNNSNISFKRAVFKIGEEEIITSRGDYTKSQPQWDLEENKEYDLVFVGKGNSDSDYEGKDVKGKIVVAERGEASFGDKSAMAFRKGAAACIIGYTINPNQNIDQLYFITVENEAPVVPTYNISNKTYDEIKAKLDAGKVKISFVKNDISNYESPVKGTMSDFNSWGPTPGLGIKPEITAPGGDIWSTANNGGYQSMSGTSMATPHVAAGIAAVRGKLAEMNNLDLPDSDIAMLVKKILMNTAKPAMTKSGKGYFSVRSQGAGIMDLDDATSGSYVTVEDNRANTTSHGDAKVEFRQINEAKLGVDLKLQSYLQKDVTYDVSYVLQTDDVDDKGSVVLDPDKYEPITLGKDNLDSITVSANNSTTLNKEITWPEDEILNKKYPNGYYVDGYIFFKPQIKGIPTISIPMLAFKGPWDTLPVIEDFIHTYKLEDSESKRPLWLPENIAAEDIYKAPVDDVHATMLVSKMLYLDNSETYNEALGRTEDGRFTDNLAISPGVKDKSQDSFKFKGVFLRNWDDFYIEISKDGNVVKKIENPYRKSGRKSGFTVNGTEIYAISEDPWFWDGTNTAGNQVPEGEYTVKIHSKMQNNPNAKADEKTVTVKVDNTKPTIDGKPEFNEGSGILKFKASDNLSGIKAVYYTYETGDKENPVVWKSTDEKIDEYYVLSGFNKDTGIVYVVDWAGNITKLDLSEKGKNQIVINRTTETGLTDPGSEIAVYNKDHKKMTNLDALEDGEYTLEALNVPEGINVEINPNKVVFPKEDKTTTETVTVKFTKVSQEDLDKYGTLNVTVVDSNVLWDGYTIYAVDKDGKKYELYSKFDWGADTYGTKVPAGEYTIVVLNSKGEEVNFAGEKKVTVTKQNATWSKLRFLKSGDLQVYLWSEVTELLDKIKSLGEKTKNENEYKFNAKEIFRAYDPETGKDLFEGTDDYEAYFKPWDDGTGFDFFIPADGNYTVELINDNREYLVDPARVDAELFTYQKDEKEKWVGMEVYYPKNKTANLTIVEELVSGETSTEAINAKYHLYDEYNNEIPSTTSTTWEGLQAKFYTLVVENLSDKLIPERKTYKIDAFNNLNVEQVVRYKDITTDPVKRFTSLTIGIYGDYDKSITEFTVKLKNVNTDDDPIEVKVKPEVKTEEITLPLGKYEATIEGLKGDTVIGSIYISSEGDNAKEKLVANGTKFTTTFTTSYNEIELNLERQKRDFGEVQVKVTGLYEGQAKYDLVKDGKVVYTSNDGIFKDVEPGDYTLRVTAPNGYKVTDNDKEVTVETGKVADVEVAFEKDTENVRTIRLTVKALEVNEYDDILRDLNGIEYVAVGKDETEYTLDKIPAGIQVKIVEKGNLPEGYERFVTNEGYRTFNDNSDITIKYINTNVIEIDPESDETKQGYVKVVFDATEHGVLNVPGIENVQKIAYLVKEDYAMDEFKFYVPTVKANENYEFKSWEPKVEVKAGTYVAQYKYHEPIVPPTPEPTPDEPSVPDYPIIPDYPVIPHRPHRPTTPTKDIVKETTKPTETVKPVEEKKDYGIVETMPTIAATFSDLPENAAAGSIMNMVARGILKGMDNGKFEGELPITRAMVATVLKRLSKDQTINTVQNFKDVKDKDWFADAVKWAQSQGIIKGYEDGTFKANNLVTRQELAIIIERFLKVHGITMDEVKELSYKDLDTLPTWSKDAIIAMAKIGLVEGQTEEMYNPTSEFTREELAVMLEKIIIWVEKH